jgi:hypothetical protein
VTGQHDLDEVNLADWQVWVDSLVPADSFPTARDTLTAVLARTESRCAAVLALVIAGESEHLEQLLAGLDSRIALRMMVGCVNRIIIGTMQNSPEHGGEFVAAAEDAARHLAALWSAYADEAEARLPATG